MKLYTVSEARASLTPIGDYSDCMPCGRCGAHRWGWAGWALPKSAPSNPAQDMLRCAECNHTARRADLQYPTVGQD